MTTYNYFCTNNDCPEAYNYVHIQKNESEEKEPEFCEHCEQEMKLVGYIPAGGYLKSSAMTRDQRKDMLRKRSKEHAKKEISEKKHEMIKQLDNGFFHKQ